MTPPSLSCASQRCHSMPQSTPACLLLSADFASTAPLRVILLGWHLLRLALRHPACPSQIHTSHVHVSSMQAGGRCPSRWRVLRRVVANTHEEVHTQSGKSGSETRAGRSHRCAVPDCLTDLIMLRRLAWTSADRASHLNVRRCSQARPSCEVGLFCAHCACTIHYETLAARSVIWWFGGRSSRFGSSAGHTQTMLLDSAS